MTGLKKSVKALGWRALPAMGPWVSDKLGMWAEDYIRKFAAHMAAYIEAAGAGKLPADECLDEALRYMQSDEDA